MFDTLKSYVKAALERDPAAKSWFEVLMLYPGVHALILHRLSHWLFNHKLMFLARLNSQLVRFFTGIEIHPGAKIGKSVFIDHGMGVVIGETAEVGNGVTIYQGVTLGGTGKEKGKRHPTVEDGVVVSSGAKVLGSMKIGKHSKIGAGAVVIKEVPPYSTVVGVPGRVVSRMGVRIDEVDLKHNELPDPVGRALETVEKRIEELEAELKTLKENPSQRNKADKEEGDSLDYQI